MQRSKAALFFFFLVLNAVAHSQYLTYRSDVKPIIEKHCTGCHAKGQIGPMPLTNYEEVSSYGNMIKYVTGSRLMPPWYADPSYRHFKNERVLTEEEIQTISDWVDGDMKEGAEPYGRIISSTAGVTVMPRDPDLIISMRQPFEQYGIYMDQYQVFVLSSGLTEDKWIEGIEFAPGNTKIVRHASISVSEPEKFDSLDRWDPRYGYFSFGGIGKEADQPFWYTWSPKQEATFYKEGQGKFLPAGSELIVHIHYGPTGVPLRDQSEVRLWFSEKKVKIPITTAPLINPSTITNDSFYIEPNEKKIFHAQYVLPQDIHLMSMTPQANLLCRSWEIFAKVPGQRLPVKLLKINDWNFNWKQTFHLESPLTLPAGTVIHAMAKYDNTLDNPCNPADKPVPVKAGAHLFSELFYVHFEYF